MTFHHILPSIHSNSPYCTRILTTFFCSLTIPWTASNPRNAVNVVETTKKIEEIAKQPGFIQCLLNIYKRNMSDQTVALYTAVTIKTHILYYWDVPSGDDYLSADDRKAIYDQLIPLLLNSEPRQRAQLVHSLGLVSNSDFPSKWQNMFDNLMPREGENFFQIAIRLDAIHTVLYKYRDAKEDMIDDLRIITTNVLPLILNILTVLHAEATKMFEIIKQANLSTEVQLTQENIGQSIDLPSFTVILQALAHSIEVFHDLTKYDIPVFVEDNMQAWFTPMFDLIQQHAYLIKPTDTVFGESIMDYLQNAIVEVFTLFSSSYDDQFKPYIEQAVGVVWYLLQGRNDSSRYDVVICACMKFVSFIARRKWYAGFFTSEKLSSIIDKVVIVHAPPRDDDLEAILCDDSYIERELIHNSNENISKRGAVIHLVSSLCTFYEENVVALVLNQVNQLIDIYKNDSSQWGALETSLLLLSTIGSHHSSTVHQRKEITTCLNDIVIPLLTAYSSQDPPSPLLITTALKFMLTYKTIVDAIPFLSLLKPHISSDYLAVASYSAFCVSSIAGFGGDVRKSISQVSLELINVLFTALNKHSENPYILAATVTIIGAAPDAILPSADELIGKMLSLLSLALTQQTNQRYLYLLFELLGIILRTVIGYVSDEASRDVTLTKYESNLMPIFEQLLNNPDCSDIHTYVIDIIAMLLEERKIVIPTIYHKVVGNMISSTTMWKITPSIPSLVRLLIATLHNNHLTTAGASTFPVHNYENQILGFYRLLLNHNKTASYAPQLGLALAAYTPYIHKYLTPILQLHFTRLAADKGSQYRVQFVLLYSFLIANDLLSPSLVQNPQALTQFQLQKFSHPQGLLHSSDEMTLESIRRKKEDGSLYALFKAMNAIQNGIIVNVLSNVWTVAMSQTSSYVDKKLLFRGTTAVIVALLSDPTLLDPTVTEKFIQSYIKIAKSLSDTEHTYIIQPSHVICADNAYAIESRSLAFATKSSVLNCTVSQQVPDPMDVSAIMTLLQQSELFLNIYNQTWISSTTTLLGQQTQ